MVADKRSKEFQQRLPLFAADSIRAIALADVPRSVVDQLTRSAASVGANYAEACNASSKLDFRNKIYISKKEAAESKYWLDLSVELSGESDNLASLQKECQEIVMILQAIVNSLNAKKPVA